MRPASSLLVLLVAVATLNLGLCGSYRPVNIATIVSSTDDQAQDNSSSPALAAVLPVDGETVDIALLANNTIPDAWLEGVAGYAAAADNRVLYETASWSLIEDGTEQDKFVSFWAKLRSLDPHPMAWDLSVCAMVAEWEDSWDEEKAVLTAVEVESRLRDKCGENDTIALAFTSAASDTAAKFLTGQIAVNDVVTSLDMLAQNSAASYDRMFVHLADGLCPRDESSTQSAQNQTGTTDSTVFSSEPCWPRNSTEPDDHSADEDSDDSGWKRDLRFIIPVGAFVFVLGCAGLVYLCRKKTTEATTTKTVSASATPKEEDKEEVSSLPYVLSMHQVA